jgi:hypothetical protein
VCWQDAIDYDEKARFPPSCELPCKAPEALRFRQQSPSFRKHDLSGRRQAHSVPAAVEQSQTQLVLELLDTVAQRGLGAVQFGSSPGESPGADNGIERLDGVEIGLHDDPFFRSS